MKLACTARFLAHVNCPLWWRIAGGQSNPSCEIISGTHAPFRQGLISIRPTAQNCYIFGVTLPAHYREIISGSRRGLVAPCARAVLAALEPAYGWVVRRKNRRC